MSTTTTIGVPFYAEEALKRARKFFPPDVKPEIFVGKLVTRGCEALEKDHKEQSSIMQNLFFMQSETQEYQALFETPEYLAANQKVDELTEGNGELQESIYALTARVEENAFAIGFQYALRLLSECNIPTLPVGDHLRPVRPLKSIIKACEDRHPTQAAT